MGMFNILPVLLTICLECILGGCQRGTDRPGDSILAGQKDSMTIANTDLGYRVVLNGEDCAEILPPDLIGIGLPQIDISEAEDGWQKVRLRWTVKQSIAMQRSTPWTQF